MGTTKISQRLFIAVKTSDKPAYKLAIAAGINPTKLSKLMHGMDRVELGDPRIVAVGAILGIPANECFEEAK